MNLVRRQNSQFPIRLVNTVSYRSVWRPLNDAAPSTPRLEGDILASMLDSLIVKTGMWGRRSSGSHDEPLLAI